MMEEQLPILDTAPETTDSVVEPVVAPVQAAAPSPIADQSLANRMITVMKRAGSMSPPLTVLRLP